MVHIRKCLSCQKYTLQEQHCNTSTILPRPPKFSLQDKYESYRRAVKKKELQEKGLY
ncbi:ribosome biogenesis protein [Candidatus Woesearchaeota archaeon]|nr:ribosome biogenesis protein [Candidatus Woesearchaeota archaeon]